MGSGRRHHPPSSHMMMKTPLRLLIALAAYQCCTALPNTNAGDVVPETKFDQLPLVTAMSSVNQVRHLPANEIISFLQADDSQCRAVSTALKSEVNTLIASDQAAFNALDTGANCPSTFQTEVNSAQTAVNNAKTAVDTATQAQAAATGSSAPITITISFTTTPSLDDFTQTSAWEAAQATYNAAVLTGATKQGELDEAEKNLVTAQSTQTEMVKACRCTAKAKYDLAVAQAQPHEAPNAASWRKAEEVICALDATSPCPSNPPANPTPPTLPAEVASVSQCKTTPAVPAYSRHLADGTVCRHAKELAKIYEGPAHCNAVIDEVSHLPWTRDHAPRTCTDDENGNPGKTAKELEDYCAIGCATDQMKAAGSKGFIIRSLLPNYLAGRCFCVDLRTTECSAGSSHEYNAYDLDGF